jgi:ATP-dependent DNA ligase
VCRGVLFSEALAAEGEVAFARACELGLEGIVSKREGSFYRSGKSRNWLKDQEPEFRQDVTRLKHGSDSLRRRERLALSPVAFQSGRQVVAMR